MAKYSDELIGVARSLYLKHWTPKEIANELNLPNARIIYYWATKWSWADMLSHESIEETINRRIQVLTHRDGKTELEHKELDSLIAHHCKLRIQQAKHAEKLAAAASQGNGEYSAAGDGDQDTGKKKRKYRKNDISALTQEDFDAFADEHLFGYQKHLRLNITQQIRNILKSRQIGATWYFAFEALENAVMTGDPQIFLSASRPQAEVFRSYIVNIAEQYFGVTLTGNPIRLSNGAELRFLSTNSNTAQSYSGHLYVDEYFWIQNFARLNEVASAMATHDRWRTTYFSTPSSKTHQAYPFWTGEDWKRGDAKRKRWSFQRSRSCATAGGFVPMSNGATSSQWKMRSPAGLTWPASTSCATSTTATRSTCFTCACSWTAATAFSASTSWSAAGLRCRSGKTTTPPPRAHSAIVKCGPASTRRAAATRPPL